jgi:hypothetical protein
VIFQERKQPEVNDGVGVNVLVGVTEGDTGISQGPRYATTIASSASTVPSHAQIFLTWNGSKLSLIASPVQSMY